jgi:hypothetical protein
MGYMPRNISITNNSFSRCSRCVADPYHAGSSATLFSVIGSFIVGPNRTAAGGEPFQRVNFRGVRNLAISGNTIKDWFHGPAISLGDATHAIVRDNHITNTAKMERSASNHGGGAAVAAAITVSDARAVEVAMNTLVGVWASLVDGIRVEENSTEGVTLYGNTLMRPTPLPIKSAVLAPRLSELNYM